MAIPSNGNFRIRAVLVLKEIDGRAVDLRALVKRRPKESFEGVWAQSGSGHRRAAGHASHKDRGRCLGPNAQDNRVTPGQLTPYVGTRTYNYDGEMFSF